MTALDLPANDASAEEWGRLAVSLPGWRWMPGTLVHAIVDGDPCMYRLDGADEGLYKESWILVHESRIYDDDSDVTGLWPDPDDPATAGCLMALLGNERWRLHLDDVGEWSFWVNGPPQTHGTGHLIHVGESLGRACIRAAAALGRWPGGKE